MSLLAALAKGLGAGTIDNAKLGFAEQQRQREAAQRKEEMTTELTAAETRLQKNIDAGKADTETRLAAQSSENEKDRSSRWAMMEKKLAAGLAQANADSSIRARENNAKSIMASVEQLAKQRADIMAISDDKISPAQRDQALALNANMTYLITANPDSQKLLGEFGYGGHIQYGLSLTPEPEPDPKGKENPETGDTGGITAPQGRPGYTKPGYGGVIGSIHQKAAPDSFWGGRETERAMYEKFNGAAPAARMTRDTQSPEAADAYRQMYK
ncbi:TPA: hypothetical protein P2I16_000161 [Aeromonas salmonicida]|nr:hypothetical protein [Aeromonas salmonicida]